MKKLLVITLSLLILNSSLVMAKTKKDQCPRMQHHSATFDQLKSIVGSWSGVKDKPDGKKEPVHVRYKTTSGDSAILETLFPGTKMEMTSVYTLQDKKIRMTHYCMMGNQPSLMLDSSTADTFHFKYVKSPGICSCKDSYMGGLTITLKDKNHMKEEWVMFEKGKKKQITQFNLTRDQK